jgi:filamentous hemagglutinin
LLVNWEIDDYNYDTEEGDYDDTLKFTKHTKGNRLCLAVLFSLLSVVVFESVACGHLLLAPVKGFGSSGAGLFWKEIDAVLDPTIVKQLHPDACGPASAATLLRGAGVDVGVSNVALAQKSVLSWGPELLVRAMNKLDAAGGWITKRLRNTRTAFDEITKNGPAGVTLFKFGMRVEHMVVVNGVDDLGRVIIRDPGNGMKYFMSWDEFQDLWTGTAIYR